MTVQVNDFVDGRTLGVSVHKFKRKRSASSNLLFGVNYTALSDRTSQPCLTLIVEASIL